MALNFNGSSDKVSIATAVANPDTSVITMHTVFRPDSTTPAQNFIAIDRESGGNGPILCIYLPGSTAAPQAFWRPNNLSSVSVNGAATISTTAFNSCQAIFEKGVGLSLYRDGVADGSTGTTPSDSHSNLGGTRMGFLQNGGAGSQFFDGDYGIGAIWSDTTGLTAGELLALGKGAHPLLVRPQALVACVELIGGRMIDWLGTGFALTGGTAVSTHPRIYRPARALVGVPATGTPTATANLTGVEALGSAGTLATSNSVNTANLAGVEAPAAAGTLGKSISKALGGVEAQGAAGTVTAAEGAVTVNLTGASAPAAAGTLATSITVATVTLTGVSGIGAAGDLAASSADSLTGRRHRTRRIRRPFPDPAITAPESAPAYVPPLPGLPLLANYEPPGVTWAETRAALAQIETLRRAVELQRDVAVYAEIERRKAEFEALAARKKQQEDEDDEAATWLLIA